MHTALGKKTDVESYGQGAVKRQNVASWPITRRAAGAARRLLTEVRGLRRRTAENRQRDQRVPSSSYSVRGPSVRPSVSLSATCDRPIESLLVVRQSQVATRDVLGRIFRRVRRRESYSYCC